MPLSMCMYMCTCMQVCAFMNVCYTYIYKSSHVCIHVCMLAHICVSLYTCICVFMCICVCPVRQILASSMKGLSALSEKKGYVKTVSPPSLEEIKKRRERFRDGESHQNMGSDMNPVETDSGGNTLIHGVKENSQIVHGLEGGAAHTMLS